MENKLPKRKHPRLNNFDYGANGAYFVTICTQNRRCVLSRIVGRGLAPAEENGIEYTTLGRIAEQQLLLLQERYPSLTIGQYVIMPNHIHAIFILNDKAAGVNRRPTTVDISGEASTRGITPRPTILDIVCAYKSLTARECKKKGFEGKLFQTSFYEHIIRNRNDYIEVVKYIYENPIRWYHDELYSDE